jgi:hypothetical protein
MVETIIQAVSPLLGMSAGAAGAAASAATAATGAGAAAFASEATAAGVSAWAIAKLPAVKRPKPKARDTSSFFMMIPFFSAAALQRFFAGFAGTDTHNLF